MIIDIHTHHPAPQPEALISWRLKPGEEFRPVDGQLYSIGVHPWDTTSDIPEETLKYLEECAGMECVKAIGECGVDTLKGGPMFRQLLVLKRHVELSEKLGKPLVIHDVKAHDVIVGLRRDLQPKQNWVIHGFRGKPTVAQMLLQSGCWLSYGEKFNPDALRATPSDRLLTETDESPLAIEEIIAFLSVAIGRDIRLTISENTTKFLTGK